MMRLKTMRVNDMNFFKKFFQPPSLVKDLNSKIEKLESEATEIGNLLVTASHTIQCISHVVIAYREEIKVLRDKTIQMYTTQSLHDNEIVSLQHITQHIIGEITTSGVDKHFISTNKEEDEEEPNYH